MLELTLSVFAFFDLFIFCYLYKFIYNYEMKPVEFIGTALDDLRAFPKIARKRPGIKLIRCSMARHRTIGNQ